MTPTSTPNLLVILIRLLLVGSDDERAKERDNDQEIERQREGKDGRAEDETDRAQSIANFVKEQYCDPQTLPLFPLRPLLLSLMN